MSDRTKRADGDARSLARCSDDARADEGRPALPLPEAPVRFNVIPVPPAQVLSKSGMCVWKNRLVNATRELCGEDAPVWWDGFVNVIARVESSRDDDNPYLRQEGHLFVEYSNGAKAGESLLRCLANDEGGE